MKGPDVSDPIWVDGPSSPHPLFPNPPSPPPPKEVPPPLIPDKNPSRGPHPVSGPGASFVFPTSQGERLRPGVPGVVVPVTRPTNIWAVRPQPGGQPGRQPGGQPGRQPGGQPGRQPGRPKPGSAQGPGSGQQKRPHQVSFRPGSPILPSVTYVGPGPNSGTPFLPGLSIKQQGRPLPGRPGTQNQGPGRVPLTPPPVSSGSSPPGQATGTTWPGNLWSQPEVINPDSGVSLYQPREPFQPYQPHDPNHPITVVDAPNMSSNQGGSPAGMPTSPLMPMGPPVHTSPSPPDMSPSESQMVADGGNPGPDAEDQISGRPQTGFPPQENVNVDSRLPDALPPFSDSSGRGKGSQEVADSHDGFEIPVSQQDHGISVIHEGQQIPFSHHSQHTPEIHEVQQIPVSHQGHTKPSNDHGQRIPTSHTDQMPFIHQGQKPTSHHEQQSTGSPKGQQTPLYNEGQHTPPQQNPENRNEQDRITEEKLNFPVAPTQPAETQPRPVRPTDSLPSSQGPVPPKESLDDLINLLYAAEAEIQHQMQGTLVTTPSTNTPDETLPVNPSSSVSFDSTASASVPDVGVSIRPEITHVPPDTVSSSTVRSTTSTTSKSISTSTTTRTATTKTTSTTPTTTTTARESNNRQDLPPDMVPPQLGKGVTVVQERPPDFHKESVEPNQVPPTLHPEDHSQPESFPPDGEREPGQRIPESENTNLPPSLNNPSFTDSIPTGSQTASRYRPGVVLPVDKSGEPLPGVRARVPPNNTQISPSRSIGRGGVPTIERVEQPSHRQHSDKTAVVQGVDLPEENISGVPEGKHKPPIPNTEFETSEVNAIDWYYSNYFREYDPYANLPVGGNEPPSGASTANVMYSTVILCMITLFYNQGHLL
ncbi:proteoglycan 4-like [Penaeus monodon]|uniref:proteoglycan 4-like n=1 Tax=Penaeus monodon TaxID=6687 RepID=UPI0018A777D8|nr:proteoglycan 4-like [Penaeus monodon]XP_037803876.1 proteoglycan 4-like [Penaeus monodon]